MITLKIPIIAKPLKIFSIPVFYNIFPRHYFSTSSKLLLDRMTQIAEGNRYYDQRNISQATSYFEQSLAILPFYLKNDNEYNQQFEQLLKKLTQCYAWQADLNKIQDISRKIKEESQTKQIQVGNEAKEIFDVMAVIGRNQNTINLEKYRIIKNNLDIAVKRFQGKIHSIPEQLVRSIKATEQTSQQDLSPHLYSEIKPGIAFVLTSLMAFPTFPTNPLFNKLCNNLLKTSQKSSQKNIPKALILLSSNLLRNNQYMQAEGMLQYCLQKKKDNLKHNILNTNQEYILMQLLLASTFERVQRTIQSARIQQEYGQKLDLQLLIAQILLLDSI